MSDVIDRCCCECGNHFDGYPEDDYCSKCWDDLNLGQIQDVWPHKEPAPAPRCEDTIDMFNQDLANKKGMGMV